MDIALLTRFFMWSTIINAVVLMVGSLLFVLLKDYLCRMHGRMFSIEPGTCGSLWYLLLGIYKIFIAVFCLIPWLTLLIIR